MTSDKVILAAGGDLRQLYAAQRLREKTGAAVCTLGLPAQPGLQSVSSPEEAPAYDVLVLPLPASRDGETVHAPLWDKTISLAALAERGKPGALMLGGGCEIAAKWFTARGMAAADYLRREELCLANAVPTAEGAVRIAMEETDRTLHGTPALILGYGRIGMALAPRLRSLGMAVTVCARRCETRALAEMQGFPAIPVEMLPDAAGKQQVLFNTVPVLLVTEQVLAKLPPDGLVIDLASRPGGTDFAAAERLGVRTVWALGIPPEAGRFHLPDFCGIVEKSVERLLNCEFWAGNCEKATKTGIISIEEF